MSEQVMTSTKPQSSPIRNSSMLHRAAITPVAHEVLQRCSNGVECLACRAEREQRERQEGSLQRAAVNAAPTSAVPPIVHHVLNTPGQPLDRGTRAFLEPRFGHDFSGVRIHTDAQAAQSARAVNALAYTVGRDVVFGSGQYMPETMEGKRLLAHELTHVVQQGGQPASLQSKLEISEVNDPLENEADKQATAIIDSDIKTFHTLHSLRPASGIIQRAAIHQGNILDEGNCTHLACNSRFACEGSNGITCPSGTRNESSTRKFRPLFTCDHDCRRNLSCDPNDTWMAIPHSRFTLRKCNQDLVICANHTFTHAYVRDRSDREAWEVSPGIQNRLGVRGSFIGAIYPDESGQAFIRDARCHGATSQADQPDVDTGDMLGERVVDNTNSSNISGETVSGATNSTVTVGTNAIEDENV